MKTSKHANVRFKQRGFNSVVTDLILNFGEEIPVIGGAYEYRIDSKTIKMLQDALDRVKKRSLVVSKDGAKIITAKVFN